MTLIHTSSAGLEGPPIISETMILITGFKVTVTVTGLLKSLICLLTSAPISKALLFYGPPKTHFSSICHHMPPKKDIAVFFSNYGSKGLVLSIGGDPCSNMKHIFLGFNETCEAKSQLLNLTWQWTAYASKF